MQSISIDIGSTWTKGALFDISDDVRMRERAVHPTTVDNLADGFFSVFEELSARANGSTELCFSSSAKGGLSVAALGIVPDVTAEMAKVTAYSAGAKVTNAFSYRLTPEDVDLLEAAPPDIILFAGGSDGGNEEVVQANAEALAGARFDSVVVYAGNKSMRDAVRSLLKDRELIVVDNILPTLDNPNPAPARQAINDIFLSRIVFGKGLQAIIEATGETPTPTPRAVYELAKSIRANVEGWRDFVLLDVGGATSDVYSSHAEKNVAGVVRRGLPEPVVKRSVEGDLGVRVSAETAVRAQGRLLQSVQHGEERVVHAFNDYVSALSDMPERLPANKEEKKYDETICGLCVAGAMQRHAGRMRQVSTVDGLVNVQTGRDLSAIPKIIGTGGYLSHAENFPINDWLSETRIDDDESAILSPRQASYHRDEHYIAPLLANIARRYPVEAAHACIVNLTPEPGAGAEIALGASNGR